MNIRKAVIPIAGSGTRIAPLNDFIHKEMLPVFDRPLIYHVINEAISAGIEHIIFVTRPSKFAVVEYLEREFLTSGCTFSYVNQNTLNGLGGALLCARNVIHSDETFAVLLPDDLIVGASCLSEMVRRYQSGNMVATRVVSRENAHKYGILNVTNENDHIVIANSVIEKPRHVEYDENYAIIGRYLLRSSIFELLQSLPVGVNGELQLSDAITLACQQNTPLCGYKFSEDHVDCGSKSGWLRGLLKIAMHDEELASIIKSEGVKS